MLHSTFAPCPSCVLLRQSLPRIQHGARSSDAQDRKASILAKMYAINGFRLLIMSPEVQLKAESPFGFMYGPALSLSGWGQSLHRLGLLNGSRGLVFISPSHFPPCNTSGYRAQNLFTRLPSPYVPLPRRSPAVMPDDSRSFRNCPRYVNVTSYISLSTPAS